MFETLLGAIKEEMLPLCSDMAKVAQAIAVLGCLVSLGMVTLKSLYDAVPIDFMAYLKPLGITFCILVFEPLVIGVLDGIMTPVAQATRAIAASQEVDYLILVDRLEDERIRQYPPSDVVAGLRGSSEQSPGLTAHEGMANLEESEIKEIARRRLNAQKSYASNILLSLLETVLAVLSSAVKMIINLVGTFFLIILAILGPLAFSAACFPMFENSISAWVSRYISTSLWLPIANLFTAVLSRAHALLCEKQLDGLSAGSAINDGLLLSMTVVGIFGYLSIPSVASWVIQAGGSGSYARNLTSKGKEAMDKASDTAGSSLKQATGAMKGGVMGGFSTGHRLVGELLKGMKYGK